MSLALRLHTLGSHSFWFDEVLTAIGAQSLAWVLYTPEIFGHPPLQYLAAWAMGTTGEGWVRAPFALAGTVSVVLLAALGRRLLGEIPASWSLSTVRIHRARAVSASGARDVTRPGRASPGP